jgi:ParB family chromosome partitioning protein
MSTPKPRLEYIPVDDRVVELKPGEFNVRRSGYDREIEELASNIKKIGILQPIIVNKVGNKYVVIAGQRRYLAAKKAGFKEIPAIVYENLDRRQAIEISLSEAIHRLDVGDADLMEAVTFLHEVYGKTSAVAQILGKSEQWVRKYLKMEEVLPEEVKRDKAISIETKSALADLGKKVIDTLGKEKTDELIIKTAEEIKEKGVKSSDAKKLIKAVEKVAFEKPKSNVEEIIKIAEQLFEKEKAREKEERERPPPEPNTIIIKLPPDTYEALDKASRVKMKDKEEVAVEYITIGLYRDGFLERA